VCHIGGYEKTCLPKGEKSEAARKAINQKSKCNFKI
jgi:hypothetical protein